MLLGGRGAAESGADTKTYSYVVMGEEVVAETANYKEAESKPISFMIAVQTKPETGLSGGALAGIIIAVARPCIVCAVYFP